MRIRMSLQPDMSQADGHPSILTFVTLCGNSCKLMSEPQARGDPVENLILEGGNYRIYSADTQPQRHEVESLIKRMYSWRGYSVDGATSSFGPNCKTLQARRDHLTVATMTVRFDSEGGLLADGLYGDELNFLRRCGGRLCELTGLAIAPGEDTTSVLNNLFEAAYRVGAKREVSDVVIEVNPRHAAHYQRLLGFRPAGPERLCSRVGAPAVLLHLDLDDLDERFDAAPAWQRQAGSYRRDRCHRDPYGTFIRFAVGDPARRSG